HLIRVSDDGAGIDADDLWLAVCRHSTSKITTAEDLTSIRTMGFRGEALASIAAVSRFKLISRTATADSAFYIYLEGKETEQSVKPAARPQGTTVEVRDLFFNTPARRKFLRTPRTEFYQIESTIQRLALCNFEVAIKLIHNNKVIYDLPAAKTTAMQERRILKLLGKDFIDHVIAIDFSASGMRLSGWIALPNFSRSQPDMQYFYLNHRYVRDKVLSHAVKNAYQDILYGGRYPAFVLYFECDHENVDVNVHPTKQEVRLRDSRSVHDFISRGVKDALEQVKPATAKGSSLIPPISIPAPLRVQEEAPLPYAAIKAPPEIIQETIVKLEDKVEYQTYLLGFAIAQLHNIYILAQNEKGLVIVDMHAAHERILYEKMKTQLSAQGIARQAMLVPINLSLTPQEMRTWNLHHHLLEKLGIMTASSGPSSILIREMPSLLKNRSIDLLVKDVLSDLEEYETSQRIENQMNSILGNIACRAAIKANHKLSIPEMNAILRDMENTPNSGFCNHGRPTWVQWSLADLDKFFLRGQ
ncbi:MAG: DNA mismatch repair endonuclease MutL, partial [Coxiellaceae bacterium]|nr:DNA mismatch repair endonuclease MutL [Coxiellaceae bacterium]